MGKEGVRLAQTVEGFTSQIADLQTLLRERAAVIPPSARGDLSVDQFRNLPRLDDVEQRIKEAERTLRAITQADAVRTKSVFRRLAMPPIHAERFDDFLGRTVEDMEASALQHLQRHFATLGSDSERWAEEGCEFVAAGSDLTTCPFCGLSLDRSSIYGHYSGFFSESYKSHKRRIKLSRQSLEQKFGGDALAQFHQSLADLQERHRFWSDFVELPQFECDPDEIRQSWVSARDNIAPLLDQKIAAPLDEVPLGPSARSAIVAYRDVASRFDAVVDSLIACNDAIERAKKEAEYGSASAVASDLGRLKATQLRHSEPLKTTVDEYNAALQEKTQLEGRKAEARGQLDRYRSEVFPEYQTATNEFLRRLNADFRLTDIRPTIPRGTPSTMYYLEIDEGRVDVASGTVIGEPAFKNTLSSGDRNTLALAFFFASLRGVTDLDETIVVIDDPASSLDDGRTLHTAHEIGGLLSQTHQLILLSHRKSLLCEVWNAANPAECTALEVRTGQGGATIVDWNVHREAITEYDRRHCLIREYLSGDHSDARFAAESLRPVLEGFLRVAFTEHFPPGTLLGNFVETARQRLTSPTPLMEQADVEELDRIKDYANRFHHDTNPSWDAAFNNLNETELSGFVRRTIRFTSFNRI